MAERTIQQLDSCIEVPLTQGYVAIIDVDDLDKVAPYIWHASLRRSGTRVYAAGRVRGRGGRLIYMHRLIANPTGTKEVDHINRNTLDNRKANLRCVEPSVNRMNCGKFRGVTTSRFRGVAYRKDRRKWQGRIKFRGKSISRLFLTEIEAARFYNEMAIAVMGDEAVFLNDVSTEAYEVRGDAERAA